ncbi:MAG: APC family permease [Fretibacterium sp.]|nr:APC family permease [Fretibacterium sp.]
MWTFTFGCLIGWGSFIMPGSTFLRRAGPLGSMFAIEIGAFIMLNISYCYYYMLQRFPDEGGQFTYATRAFGRVHGFIFAWFLGFCYICILPLNATALHLLARTMTGSLFQFGFHYTVAGYEVYMGEVLLAMGALVVFALFSALNIAILAKVQITLVALQLVGVLAMVIGAMLNPGKVLHEDLGPLFLPNSPNGVFMQMFSVIAISPWAFVGFEVVPTLSQEGSFSREKVKVIMDTSILMGAFFYIAMTLMAALAIPVGYSTWVEYIYGLPYLRGMASVPTAFAAHRLMGETGSVLWGLAAFSAAATSIIGFYVATSRLLYNMAREGMLPRWFGRLTRHGVPANATFFCMVISLFVPFMGRTVLGWAVDMSSLGGAIGFGYTSLAAWKYARQEGRRDITTFGGLGFGFSVFFALLLLIPIPGLNCAMGWQSWLCLILWTVLGAIFLLHVKLRPMGVLGADDGIGIAGAGGTEDGKSPQSI